LGCFEEEEEDSFLCCVQYTKQNQNQNKTKTKQNKTKQNKAEWMENGVERKSSMAGEKEETGKKKKRENGMMTMARDGWKVVKVATEKEKSARIGNLEDTSSKIFCVRGRGDMFF
jgi:multidrug efflux pump subunit AcrB